jgi:hypothetical protein
MRIRRVRAAMVVAAVAALTLLTSALAPAGASAVRAAGGTAGNRHCRNGAPGVGDPYYPLYGNGGYDVQHYLLKVRYNPATDRWPAWRPSRRGPRRTCAGSTSTSRG